MIFCPDADSNLLDAMYDIIDQEGSEVTSKIGMCDKCGGELVKGSEARTRECVLCGNLVINSEEPQYLVSAASIHGKYSSLTAEAEISVNKSPLEILVKNFLANTKFDNADMQGLCIKAASIYSEIQKRYLKRIKVKKAMIFIILWSFEETRKLCKFQELKDALQVNPKSMGLAYKLLVLCVADGIINIKIPSLVEDHDHIRECLELFGIDHHYEVCYDIYAWILKHKIAKETNEHTRALGVVYLLYLYDGELNISEGQFLKQAKISKSTLNRFLSGIGPYLSVEGLKILTVIKDKPVDLKLKQEFIGLLGGIRR
jgi:hypothetical protein